MATLNNLKIGDYLQGQHSKLVYKIINIHCGFTTIQEIKSLKEYSISHKYLYIYNKIEKEKEKMFTKDDLKTGDFIIRKNGSVELFLLEQGVFVVKIGGYNVIEHINEDLTYYTSGWNNNCSKYDIVKVYRPTTKFQYSFTFFDEGELVFDRDRDCPKETIMTISEVEEKLGVKNLKIVKEK